METLTTDASEHGELLEGWSQQESASPHVVGDLAGATRQTTYTARARSKADLMIGRTVQADGVMDSTGPVLDVTLTGDDMSTSVYDIDSKFLPVKAFPPVSSGFPEAALDLAQRMLGDGNVASVPWESRGVIHAYYPLRGYAQGFELGTGAPWVQSWGDAAAGGVWSGTDGREWYWGEHALLPRRWVQRNTGHSGASGPVALRVMWGPVTTGASVNYMALRARFYASGSFVEQDIDIDGIKLKARIESVDGTGTGVKLRISGQYKRADGVTVTITPVEVTDASYSWAGRELAFAVQWGWTTPDAEGTLRVRGYWWDAASPPAGAHPPARVAQADMPTAVRHRLVSNGSFVNTGTRTIVYDAILSQAPAGLDYHYAAPPATSWVQDDIPRPWVNQYPSGASMASAVGAWTGSGWDYLKHLCSAHGLVMRVDAGRLRVSALTDGTPVPVRGENAPPVLQLRAGGRARSVDVMKYKATESASTMLGNFMNEPVNHEVKLTHTVRMHEDSVITATLPPGEYLAGRLTAEIQDADGAEISGSSWWGSWGRLATTVEGGVLTVRVKGPRFLVDGGKGPWTIHKLLIANAGFYVEPSAITMYTGADDSMVTRDKAPTVANPFIVSAEMAYARGAWAAAAAGDPDMVVSFTVNAARRGDYLPGALVRYGHAVYRVMDVKHTRAAAQVTAVRWVTVARRDAAWAGVTVADHDTWAAGRRNLDAYARPLETPTTDTPFVRAYPSQSKLEA